MQDETLLKPVKTLMEAMQTENAELIRAQFWETATQAYGSDGVMKTAEETKTWIESDIVDSKGKVDNNRKRVREGKRVTVRVDLGGRSNIKKKKMRENQNK